MNELLAELQANWVNLEHVGLSVGLCLNSPLDKSVIMRGLDRLSSIFPELSQSSFDDEKNVFMLESDETDVNKQANFKLRDARMFLLTWGPLVDYINLRRIDEFWKCISTNLEVFPVNMHWLDYAWQTNTDWPHHQYHAIVAAFYGDNIGRLFPGETPMQADLAVRASIDDIRVCTVAIDSDLTESEIRSRDYSNCRLRVRIGIAQTKGFQSDMDLSQQFLAHYKVASPFLRDKVRPLVHDRLDRILRDASDKDASGKR